MISNDNARSCTVLLVKNTWKLCYLALLFRFNISLLSILHYFVPGYYEHSYHKYINCAFYLEKIWYFYIKTKITKGLSFIFHITILRPCSLIIHSVCPKSMVQVPLERWISSIFLFVMHGCISIHQIYSTPAFSPLNGPEY